jgi:hypothetical protein
MRNTDVVTSWHETKGGIELGSFSNLSNTCLTEGAKVTRKRGNCPENDSAMTHIDQERYE